MPSKNAESDDEETIDKEEQEEGSDEVRLRYCLIYVLTQLVSIGSVMGRGRLTWHGHLESMLIM